MSGRVVRARPSRRTAAHLAGVPIGGASPVAVMGALNASPESFYAGSVRTGAASLREAAQAMAAAGAALVDVGARSTAPYRMTQVTEGEECARLVAAVRALVPGLPVPVSVDTARPGPARAALAAGATVVNDVTGLADPAVARLIAAHDAGVILGASPAAARAGGVRIDPNDPTGTVRASLVASLERAAAAGIPADRIVLDPGIGFFLEEPAARAAWDVHVLAGLARLAELGRPLAVGVSRKSFVGTITGRERPEDRLPGSLAAVALAVVEGASLIRTHDVGETLDAVRVAERLASASAAGAAPRSPQSRADR